MVWEFTKTGYCDDSRTLSCPRGSVNRASIVSTGLHQLPPLTANGTTSVFRGKAARVHGNFTKMATSNFNRGHTIRQGGTIVLGQDQDSVGGGFQTSESFQGMLSNVNLWNQVLTDSQIEHMSKSCLSDEARDRKEYKWLDFVREGGATLVEPSPCKMFGAGKWRLY